MRPFGMGHLASWVDEAAERAPRGTEDQLHAAASRVRDEVALGREAATALPDRDYDVAAVRDGTLFKLSERAAASSSARSTNCGSSSGKGPCRVAAGASPRSSASR